MEKTILVVGAGVGGIVTARELRRHLGNRHRIVLLDRSSTHSFQPSYLWVMVGWRAPAAIQKPLRLLEKHGIIVRQEEVRAVDPGTNRVETDREALAYDYLVLSPGAELIPRSVPGWSDRVHSFYTLEGAEALRDALLSFSGGTIAIVVGGIPYKCPPAPYEAAFILESYFARRLEGGVKIEVFTPEASPLSATGPDGGKILSEMLKNRGIGLYLSHAVISIDAKAQSITFENGAAHRFDLLIGVPPHASPRVIRDARLTDQTGWVPVEERSLRTRFRNIFAIGDVTSIPLASGGALPKAGVFAAAQGEVVAHNIAQEILGHRSPKAFPGVGDCYLETGYGRAGHIHGNFLARPAPLILFDEPSVTHHWKKVVFEKYWLWRWF
jgi:sulfide:quinone oxidoreductase